MALSTDVISQFVKMTNDTDKRSKSSAVWGTVVKNDKNELRVQLDGSAQTIPVETTADYREGDRVSVTIKDHIAIATGNKTAPATHPNTVDEKDNAVKDELNGRFVTIEAETAKIKNLEAETAKIKNLEAETAKIKNLEAETAKIKNLEAETAKIKNLEAETAKIKNLEAETAKIENLEAETAKIKDLEADNAIIQEAVIKDLTADDGTIKNLASEYATIINLDATNANIENLSSSYANIDFANIDMAAVKNLFAKSGIIRDLVVGDEHITGELVGVTIKGDIIEGNTIVADKLVVRGDDGLFYKLNTQGVGLNSPEVTYESTDIPVTPIGGHRLEGVYTKDGLEVFFYEVEDSDGKKNTNYYVTKWSPAAFYTDINDAVDPVDDLRRLDGAYDDFDVPVYYRNTTDENGNIITEYYTIAADVYFQTRLEIGDDSIAIVEECWSKGIYDTTNREIYYYIGEDNNVYYCVPMHFSVTATATGVTFEQTEYNSLNGSVITAKSIVATQIDVHDLVAFDATIGGFKIASDSLYSGVKNSANNTTRGVYLDSHGQVNVGDSNNFIKYYCADVYNETANELAPAVETDTEVPGVFTTDGRQVYSLVSNISESYPVYYPVYYYERGTDRRYYTVVGDKYRAVDTNTVYQHGVSLGSAEPDTFGEWVVLEGAYTDRGYQVYYHDDETGRKYYMRTSSDYRTVNAVHRYRLTEYEITPVDGVKMESYTTNTLIEYYTKKDDVRYKLDRKEVYRLAISAESIEFALNGSKRSLSELGNIGEYVHITTYKDEDTGNVEPCIELGEADSNFRLIITNTRILFMDGVDHPACITNKALHIEKAVVENELQFGQFTWKKRENGNMGILWITGEESD